ncbi:FRG domain-containing protein (plasmid) [Alicyclobacillus fastidiosus]|uniref:FRG domain-containing protein n=1 Tax=Alicyclobacillus fastidiosus TaxID=392011 RepID=A0ABY6ZPQ7_9BACL|nr:FRG domain-containing protein [Alicyclobacillus fastidiosus]WAH44832.1 FRG domain-containing protein [Alicyclobacillus fastidiosus]
MTIKTIVFDKLKNALTYLENLSLSNQLVVYRGHQNSKWRLQTTLSRFKRVVGNQDDEWFDFEVGAILEQFKGNLSRLGDLPFPNNSRSDWLEYAQHHGVPTPFLDFTYSPYVALFFAFNGIRINHRKKGERKKYVAIYALNVNQLAHAWSLRRNPFKVGEINNAFFEDYHEFLNPQRDPFNVYNTKEFVELERLLHTSTPPDAL